ncbi:hypothetical protein [Candidatus Nitrosocosmicus hydrocola]|uniref:hypothetical protein n=1 Tax=Candidatus Nitrosocosmicus hydrocola TaxID=1826872 RepID=UPI001E302367|nr:hypothetical protein [Candidatus Nitrosocosmicus hydrocola]
MPWSASPLIASAGLLLFVMSTTRSACATAAASSAPSLLASVQSAVAPPSSSSAATERSPSTRMHMPIAELCALAPRTYGASPGIAGSYSRSV